MLKTNTKQLVIMSVQGKVAAPPNRKGFRVDCDGKPFMLPATGGIVYNVKVGDSAMGWQADHLEPCVSTVVNEEKRQESINAGYHFYCCVGNEARIVTGDAKGTKGVVTGHHGGIEHIIIDFPDKALDKMTLDDKILVKGFGQGLRLTDYPQLLLMNLDPNLLKRMGLKAAGNKIEVPVAAVVPGKLMGSGVGQTSMGTGDYDIMTTDQTMLKKYNLTNLRLGDFVAIQDHDNLYGRSYRKGAMAIGIVVHADCRSAGHGPGVTTLIAASKPLLKPMISKHANIADIMKIGRRRGRN